MVSTSPMSTMGRATERGETKGFMKVVADAETKEILGAAILGIEGDEAIHGFIDAMNAGTTYPVLRWSVPIHPTVSNSPRRCWVIFEGDLIPEDRNQPETGH